MPGHFRRMFLSSIVAVGAAIPAARVAAQVVVPTPREIGQIVNEVLDSLAPRTGPHASIIWKRGVVFDYTGTLSAFHQDSTLPPAELGIAYPMAPASRTLLKDCNQLGQGPCRELDSNFYVIVGPITLSRKAAAVRAFFMYAARARRPGSDSGILAGPAYLNGSSTVVYLTRRGNGPWKFLKKGETDMY